MNTIQISKILILVFTLFVICHLLYQTYSYKETYQNLIAYGLFPEKIEKPLLDDVYKDPKRNRYENPTLDDLSNYNVTMAEPPKRDNKRVNYYNYTNKLK